jgi:hypothetical protein
VLAFCPVFHGEGDDGIGVIVVHGEDVLMSMAANVWKSSLDVRVCFVRGMEGINHDIVSVLFLVG